MEDEIEILNPTYVPVSEMRFDNDVFVTEFHPAFFDDLGFFDRVNDVVLRLNQVKNGEMKSGMVRDMEQRQIRQASGKY